MAFLGKIFSAFSRRSGDGPFVPARAVRRCLGDPSRSGPREPAGLYRGADPAGGCPPGGSDGARDVDGVALRDRRHLLGLQARRGSGGDRRSDRSDALRRLRGGDGAVGGGDGDGGAPVRGERPGRGRPRRCSGDLCRRGDFGRHRGGRHLACAAAPLRDGGLPRRGEPGGGLHRGDARRKCHRRPSLSGERDLPRGGRRRGRSGWRM